LYSSSFSFFVLSLVTPLVGLSLVSLSLVSSVLMFLHFLCLAVVVVLSYTIVRASRTSVWGDVKLHGYAKDEQGKKIAASFVVPEGFRMTSDPPEELALPVQKQNPKVDELLGRRLCIGGRVLGGVEGYLLITN
jgi:hypothetical protein